MSKSIPQSELPINPDGRVYHLNLKPEELADTIITVGDPERVNAVSKYFDSVDIKIANREFITHTGMLNNKRLSVVATGIGTSNIDIVMNELDVLANIDFQTRTIKNDIKQLDMIRIGTSGGLQADTAVDSFIISEHAIGLDGLLLFYQMPQPDLELANLDLPIKPYITAASESLFNKLKKNCTPGVTATCIGFYAPQGRELRYHSAVPHFIEQLGNATLGKNKITNFEMETAAIYGLGKVFNHNAVSISTIINNRTTGEFSKDYKKAVDKLIQQTLEQL